MVAVPGSHPPQSMDALISRLIRTTESSLLSANLPLTSKPAEIFYASILDTFQPRPYTGLFSSDRLVLTASERNQSSLSLCIRGLLPFANPAERQLLDMALFGLLTLYMSRLAEDAKMTAMACSAYGSAIRDFRHAIGWGFPAGEAAAKTERMRFLIAYSTALQLFEVSYVGGQPLGRRYGSCVKNTLV